MGKKEFDTFKNLFADNISDISITEEQYKFLIDLYKDKNCIIGLHNTVLGHKPFFKNGLYNYTSMYRKSQELSNTVFFEDLFPLLAWYPSGKEGDMHTTIILKIPKDVLLHKQGIFETLSDGKYGIPPQFIAGAFEYDRCYSNDNYNPNYSFENALKCEDNIKFQNKNKQIKYSNNLYYKQKNKDSWIRRFLNSIKNWKKNKDTPLLEQNNENVKSNNTFIKNLHTETTSSPSTINNNKEDDLNKNKEGKEPCD